MDNISSRDIDNLKESIIQGCNEFIFDSNYTDKFLEINNINFEEDSIIFFKNRNYSNSRIFQIIFSNSLTINYSEINSELLSTIKSLAISDDKIDVSTLMAYTCLESIDNNLNLETFMNKFETIKYFVENKFSLEETKPKLEIVNYYNLANHKALFYTDDGYYKSKDEISNIIKELNEQMPINCKNFDEVCSTFENLIGDLNHKKM